MSWEEAREIMGTARVLLGPQASHQWRCDPKHLLFVLARYKHAARLIGSARLVLEVGCGEGIGARILRDGRVAYLGVDPDREAIAVASEDASPDLFAARPISALAEITSWRRFDAAVALDVIEHQPAPARPAFLATIAASLAAHGVCVIGTPSASAAAYQSEASRAGHHALLSALELRALLDERFRVVQLFGMNDEVLHTGFLPMAHYLLGVGIGPR